jgi:ribulose-phosphate 3-epimerase
MQIIPSILVQSKEEFETQIKSVEGVLNTIQLDIADGKFVPNNTWADPDVVEKVSQIDIELHLMVENPLRELERWSACEQAKRVLIHYETTNGNLASIMQTVKEYGWQVGVVLNPDTPTDLIDDYIDDLDSVMFMGVVPGFQGQCLIPEVLEKIRDFKSLHPTVFTEIDGAVNEETLPDIIASGVDAICPGSAIFKNDRTPEENVKRMQEIINRLTNV